MKPFLEQLTKAFGFTDYAPHEEAKKRFIGLVEEHSDVHSLLVRESVLLAKWQHTQDMNLLLPLIADLAEALEFYADPETYFGIGFLPDKPCGPFISDGSETELGRKPGAQARATLERLKIALNQGDGNEKTSH